MQPATTCINCGSEISDKFCSQCGQRTGVKRITFREGWFDFWSRIYGFDGMFPRTLRDLTLRPGEVARSYIEGNRARYYGPVGYFFLMITLYLILLGVLGIDIRDFITQNQNRFNSTPPDAGQAKIFEAITTVMSEYVKILFFLIVFFQGIAARYFFFRKTGLNLLEHTVLPLYTTGHGYWLSMILAVVYKFYDSFTPNDIAAFFIIAYFGYAYISFISKQSKWKLFFKGLGTYVTAYILFVVAIIVITILIIIVLGFIDPSSLDSIRPSNNP